MKIHDGTTWQEAKSLKIHNGSAWVNAVKSWVYNGSWQVVYPNSPIAINGPTPFIYSGKTYPSPGSTWTPTHNWNMDPAYAPTSYTYQWKRSNVNISGATSPTYTATVADIGSTIGVSITATNGRGSTTISGDAGTVILPMVTSVIAYDSTPYPTQPSVSITTSNLNYSGSWGTSTYATSYSISTNNGSVSPTYAVSSGNYSGSGSAGGVQITVTPTNSNKQVTIVWSAAEGASSYDVVKYGNNITTTRNRPSSDTSYTWEIADGNESNYFSVYPKTSSGTQGYGLQTIASASNKSANPGYASGTLVSVPAPSGGSVSLSPAGTQQAGTTIYASTSGWSGSPTVYEIKILKATGTPPTESGGNATSNGTVMASTTSHQITAGEASGTPDQFTAFARAYNDGGWSGWIASNTVVSTPVPAVVTYTATYNANGGSPGGTSTYTAGGITYAPSAPSRSGYTFNGWYDTASADYTYNVSGGGGWYPPSRDITMTARWSSNTPSGSAPTITVSNTYDGSIGGKYQWTLTINNTGSAATSYSWGVQFSNSNGGTVNASTTGSGGSIAAGGSVTVTRNDATNNWARWVNVTASNGYGTSTVATTGWA